MMAIQCFNCDNFFSPEVSTCPICGTPSKTDSDRQSSGSQFSHGLIYEIWDNFLPGRGESALSRNEVFWLKVLMGMVFLLLAVVLFRHP